MPLSGLACCGCGFSANNRIRSSMFCRTALGNRCNRFRAPGSVTTTYRGGTFPTSRVIVPRAIPHRLGPLQAAAIFLTIPVRSDWFDERMVGRCARILLVLWQAFCLNVFIPAHTRGAMTVPGVRCNGTAEGHACCSHKPPRGDKPTPEQRSRCAVCYFAM